MSWYYKGERLICTGPCRGKGYVPCPVDHAAQPLVDDGTGDVYFRCDECDWVIPDDFKENEYETAGMVPCPECRNGENDDTYDSSHETLYCELCDTEDTQVKKIPIPVEVTDDIEWIRWGNVQPMHPACRDKLVVEMTAALDAKPCPGCGATGCVRTYDMPEHLRTWQEKQGQGRSTNRSDFCYMQMCLACFTAECGRRADEQAAWRRRGEFLEAGGINGTCTTCGKQGDLEFVPHQDGRDPEYVCGNCGGLPHPLPVRVPVDEVIIPSQRCETDTDDDWPGDPPRGWYQDPEYDGYYRWWTGHRWSGGPTEPEHCLEFAR